MKYLTTERLRLKAFGKQGDKEAEYFADAMKVLINSGYGFLTTDGIPFNDFESGSKVPAYGREMLNLMLNELSELGSEIIEADTDGIIFKHPDSKKVHQLIQNALPDGINIELEWIADAVYVPKAKSYIVFHNSEEIKKKGIFIKRNSNWIHSEFPVEYLKQYLESPEKAMNYFLKVFDEIRERIIDIRKLQVTKRIPKNNKSLTHLGNQGDKITYWMAKQPKHHKTTGEQLKSDEIPTDKEPYFIDYYLGELEDVRREINKVVEQVY
jgi:DNA polymerase I